MIHSFEGFSPECDAALFVAWNAEIVGRVRLGERTSVWFGATLRGDIDTITVGEGSNVQDGAVIHVDFGISVTVGDGVTVGHGAILHGCTIADNVLIGMGSTVLNGAIIEEHTIVGAGALVPPGKRYPPRTLLMGVPARAVREVTDEEIVDLKRNAEHYVANASRYAVGLNTIR